LIIPLLHPYYILFIPLLGADLVLSKPINKADLIAALETTLNAKNDERAQLVASLEDNESRVHLKV
jgi:hypothetical protein